MKVTRFAHSCNLIVEDKSRIQFNVGDSGLSAPSPDINLWVVYVPPLGWHRTELLLTLGGVERRAVVRQPCVDSLNA